VATNAGTKFNRDKPHIVATGPNEVWSWDTTQLRSDIRMIRFYLYVIIDIWSRLVVGWCLEEEEKTEHAIELWKQALEKQYITGDGLINHKDNGGIMTSGRMIKFVKATGMIDSYSRAGKSNDNPFSEAFFRTVKYFREYPGHFSSPAEGRAYLKKFFDDYNFVNRHSGIQFLAPAQRHYGEEEKILAKRNAVIDDFYKKNKHRYSSKKKLFLPITEVRIN
jgi:transposase InsO family protein